MPSLTRQFLARANYPKPAGPATDLAATKREVRVVVWLTSAACAAVVVFVGVVAAQRWNAPDYARMRCTLVENSVTGAKGNLTYDLRCHFV